MKKSFIYAQIWDASRVTLPQHTGARLRPASATAMDDGEFCPYISHEASSQVASKDFPPQELDLKGIDTTINAWVQAAKKAIEIGFDEIEVHGANDYCTYSCRII